MGQPDTHNLAGKKLRDIRQDIGSDIGYDITYKISDIWYDIGYGNRVRYGM